MKRLAAILVIAVIASPFAAGCGGGGIPEGMPTDPLPATGQPDGFREMMERDSKNMQLKSARPKIPPTAPKQ
jgi:hypothetical protein